MVAIQVNGLAKSYGAKRVVQDVSFSVQEGEIFGILGPNGAGKTTSVECVVGLRRRDAGEVTVLGVDPARDRDAVRRQVGVQLQHAELPERMTVADALRLYASFYDHPADPDELLHILGLDDQRRTRFAKLSGGQQQRLSIALALVGDPKVAVLDELTTGLDPAARRETWRLIERMRERGVTILLVTHFMQEAEYLCDRLAVIAHGRVIALDTPAGVVAANEALATQRMRFTPSQPVEDRHLLALPEVTHVERHAQQLVVSGTGDLVSSVTGLLARAGIVAGGLRVDQPTLDDAFVALTHTDRTERSA